MIFYDEDLFLANNTTTHIILKENKYFEYLTLIKANVTKISCLTNMIKGSKSVNNLLSNNTKLSIKDELYSPESTRNLTKF
jgi:hypothetical protein